MSFGCQEMIENPAVSEDSESFCAIVEDFESATKTSMTGLNEIVWSEGDRIAIFQGCNVADKYLLAETSAGTGRGEFVLESDRSEVNDDFSSGMEITANIAVYPYADDLDCEVATIHNSASQSEVKAYKVQGLTIPTVQNYVENSFGPETFPMIAVTKDMADHVLKFKNLMGVLKLQLKGTEKVKTVKVEGTMNEKLSGDVTVNIPLDNTPPTLMMAEDAATYVQLDCGSGVQLNESSTTAFYISLPPVLFTQGFRVTITYGDGSTKELEAVVANEIRRSSILVMPDILISDSDSNSDIRDLSEVATANCYIVSEAGAYKFRAVKGNGTEVVGAASETDPVGNPTVAEVLWESFGTDTAPQKGDLIKVDIEYRGGYVYFSTADTYKEGNAVIAIKDVKGTDSTEDDVILWSWHIWLTDQPAGQNYNNNAGTMMDRNLGATSAAKGDVGALGLLYQWGRKDPFLGSSSISESTEAASTIEWPASVKSTSETGTIEYSVTHPTTFIFINYKNSDWYYTGSQYTDDTRWTTSESEKSIYDPCPAGWRVPDGAEGGIWSKAKGSSSDYYTRNYDSTDLGMNFSGDFGAYQNVWYPAAGCRYYSDGSLSNVGYLGYYWSATPFGSNAFSLNFYSNGGVYPSNSNYRAYRFSVRCLQE